MNDAEQEHEDMAEFGRMNKAAGNEIAHLDEAARLLRRMLVNTAGANDLRDLERRKAEWLRAEMDRPQEESHSPAVSIPNATIALHTIWFALTTGQHSSTKTAAREAFELIEPIVRYSIGNAQVDADIHHRARLVHAQIAKLADHMLGLQPAQSTTSELIERLGTFLEGRAKTEREVVRLNVLLQAIERAAAEHVPEGRGNAVDWNRFYLTVKGLAAERFDTDGAAFRAAPWGDSLPAPVTYEVSSTHDRPRVGVIEEVPPPNVSTLEFLHRLRRLPAVMAVDAINRRDEYNSQMAQSFARLQIRDRFPTTALAWSAHSTTPPMSLASEVQTAEYELGFRRAWQIAINLLDGYQHASQPSSEPRPFTIADVRDAIETLERNNVPRFGGEYVLLQGTDRQRVVDALARPESIRCPATEAGDPCVYKSPHEGIPHRFERVPIKEPSEAEAMQCPVAGVMSLETETAGDPSSPSLWERQPADAEVARLRDHVRSLPRRTPLADFALATELRVQLLEHELARLMHEHERAKAHQSEISVHVRNDVSAAAMKTAIGGISMPEGMGG